MSEPDKHDVPDPRQASTAAADDRPATVAEQQSGQDQPPHAASPGTDDDWAAALAEQAATTGAVGDAAPRPAAAQVFQPLTNHEGGVDSDIDMVTNIPVQLTVELGRTRLTIKNILQLGQGSVVELDELAGEPMDIYVNGYLIAQGEVVAVDDKYGIRVTDIITPADRIARLNSRR